MTGDSGMKAEDMPTPEYDRFVEQLLERTADKHEIIRELGKFAKSREQRLAVQTALVERVVELLKEASEKHRDWHEQIDGGDSDGTVFGYCRECGTVEYRDHKAGCEFVERQARFDAFLAEIQERGKLAGHRAARRKSRKESGNE